MHQPAILPLVVAAISAFVLGGLWYSPLMFLKPWMKANVPQTTPGAGHPAKVFGLSFIFALIAAYAFGMLVGPHPTWSASLGLGAVVGAGFVATSYGINYQFANRSTMLWLIDSGYHLAKFLAYGAIYAWLG